MGSNEWIDLSHPYTPGMSVRAGAPVPTFEHVQCTDQVGRPFEVLRFSLTTHLGTHVDLGPLDRPPPERFCGEASVLDLRGREAGALIDRNDVEKAAVGVRDGDIILLCLGWSDRFGSNLYLQQPIFTEDAVRWLIGRRPLLIGIDASGFDSGSSHEPLDGMCFEHGIPVIENLTGLDRVVGERIYVWAFPIDVAGADALPVRVVARRARGD